MYQAGHRMVYHLWMLWDVLDWDVSYVIQWIRLGCIRYLYHSRATSVTIRFAYIREHTNPCNSLWHFHTNATAHCPYSCLSPLPAPFPFPPLAGLQPPLSPQIVFLLHSRHLHVITLSSTCLPLGSLHASSSSPPYFHDPTPIQLNPEPSSQSKHVLFVILSLVYSLT